LDPAFRFDFTSKPMRTRRFARTFARVRSLSSYPLTTFIETAEFFMAKLRRYTADVNVEEMQCTPAGIANSLAWIVRRCADLLWLSYGRLAGERIPVNLGGSGIAGSSVKGATFLQHNLGDLCYHTGQASYLRKLLAAERRRVRARRRRAELV
jgi:hypothetical protein